MMRNYALQQAGYPFVADDLTLEEWVDIGLIAKLMSTPAGKKE